MADNKDLLNTTENTSGVQKTDVAKREEDILAFWDAQNIFKKTEAKNAPKGEYVFYDGPPFANGLPHYGHILASTIKDAIPRYQTMRGSRVARRWGWDCHGLPVENLIEKELGLKTKQDIEVYGVEKFNEAARHSIMKDAEDWKKIIPRLGRFVDMDNGYKTMDTPYTESVWWVFKTLFDKGLIYKGFKSMHLCPRCGTTLSNFEVNLGYKDIKDFSVTVKFELIDEPKNTPKTFVLAWTTTPWTLPGNTAVAVHEDLEYVTVEQKDAETNTPLRFILAKDRLTKVFKEGEYTIVDTYKGSQLIGKKYKPPFDYYAQENVAGKKNGWKIYHAPYVTTEDGTGIVHLAPAFGEEDLLLAQKEGIPIIHHVTQDGVFDVAVTDFKGMPVKPKEDHMATDIEIIKALAQKGLLFAKEKIEHAYPHCWRCDTPLLNYASSSWFVRVTEFKDTLVAENKKIQWVPKEVGENRFGNWLENARDWAISRTRYWGAPLPVWENKKRGSVVAVGSIEELKKYIKKSGNQYLIMRHGEALSNTKNTLNADPNVTNPLTESGKETVCTVAEKLKGKKIDIILHSPLQRTKETAHLLVEKLGISKDVLKEDARLKEVTFGEFEGKSVDDYHSFFQFTRERMIVKPARGESWNEVKDRVTEVLYDFEKEYEGKTILIISHNGPLQMIQAGAEGQDVDGCGECIANNRFDLMTGEVRELLFVPLPHNKDYELDLHRPYIDDVVLVDSDGSELVRVPDVFDCWYESGSMPYGQQHYPFENTDTFEPKSGLFKKSKGYPADFIAEGMDQTRGWFYSLIVLGVALFGKAPYKHVIVNGLVLAEDGQKMSKRLKNYPDPVEVMQKYGADALRFYLLSSPIVRGEDLNFSEKGVDEVSKKLLGRLSNVLSFYELYASPNKETEQKESDHVLDRWITARTHELSKEVTDAMERYELDKATRPILLFIDDLSTWYIRRSRDRFKGYDTEDKEKALQTTRFVLKQLSKVMAPFMPFYAETLYQSVKMNTDSESVHLSDWPRTVSVDKKVLDDMI
ncbi:MAG: class I tRNA ligase family protein, partial [Candidatus Paceibacterota bacterium]